MIIKKSLWFSLGVMLAMIALALFIPKAKGAEGDPVLEYISAGNVTTEMIAAGSSDALTVTNNAGNTILLIEEDGDVIIGPDVDRGEVHNGNEFQIQSAGAVQFTGKRIDTSISSGDDLWNINVRAGEDGSEAVVARINVEAESNWNAGDSPTRIGFEVAADGTETALEYMRIEEDGEVEISNVLASGDVQGGYPLAITKDDNSSRVGLRRVDADVGASITIGGIAWLGGEDGTENRVAEILAISDASAWTATHSPTRLIFGVTADNAVEETEVMRLNRHGDLMLGTTTDPTAGTSGKVMIFGDNTQDPTPGADTAAIYAKDVAGTVHMFAEDEAGGGGTQISPHSFVLFEPDPTEPSPWSYYSEDKDLGMIVNVDMAGAIRAIEALAGEAFIHYTPISRRNTRQVHLRRWRRQWIEANTTHTEIPEAMAYTVIDVQEVSAEEALEHYEINVPDKHATPTVETAFRLTGTGDVVAYSKTTYPTKLVPRKRLKRGYKFRARTGKFFRLGKRILRSRVWHDPDTEKYYRVRRPTLAEVKSAVATEFKFELPKWKMERLLPWQK